MTRALYAVLCVLAALLSSSRAYAQDKVQVRAGVEPTIVEIGGVFAYTLQVSVTDGQMPSNPLPGSVAGLPIVGSSSSPMHMAMNMNGVASRVETLSTTWQLQASKLGTFNLGPATAMVGQRTVKGNPVTIQIVARGKAPARPAPNPFAGSPFDPFGNAPLDPFKGAPGTTLDHLKDLLGDFDDDLLPVPRAPKADDLGLDAPRAPNVFLHAVVDKSRAVVGEQVTLFIYLYSRPNLRLPKPRDVHLPSVPGFTRKSILPEDRSISLGRTNVGGQAWDVELVTKDALFPIATGKQSIGEMSMTFATPQAGLRSSEPLAVDVVEPPASGRPPGYVVGDVGDYALEAQVQPRRIARGGSVGVTLELRGTGNLPPKVALPLQPGVEWLDAQSSVDLHVVDHDRVGGKRTFSHIVRIDKEGAVDLGAVTLAFFDPATKQYRVARATLGIVDVGPGVAKRPAEEPEEEVLPGLPAPRTTLEGTPVVSAPTEHRLYWPTLLGLPLVTLGLVLGGGAARRLREKRRLARPSPERTEREAHDAARAALAEEDGAKAVSAVLRALTASLVRHTGVRAQGLAGNELVKALEEAGVSEEAAREASAIVRAGDDARFSPAGTSVDDARALWDRVTALLPRLEERA